MREIKFRCWNIKEKKMYFDITDLAYTNVSNGFMLLQFTGLLDSKGKEIYEGDVVTFIGGNSIHTMGENSDIRVVEILDDTKQLGWKGSGYTFCETNCKELVEIIGNIWENPELLELKKTE